MPTDWESRYQSKDMPWEKGEASPGLIDFLASHSQLERGTVLVPGCGTGHDVRAWAAAGFAATGYDIAASAVTLSREKTAVAGVKAEFIQGDFLSETPPQPFDWIFEHTLFCAIDPQQRADYVRATQRWLKPRGHYLSVNYMIPDTDGPPFGVTRAEVMDWFSPGFELLEEWVPRSWENRAGLELMTWWRKR